MSFLDQQLNTVSDLITQLIDAASGLASIVPAHTETRLALLEATAELHKARALIGVEAPSAALEDCVQRLPSKTRLTIAQAAYQVTALELLGASAAAEATYRLADRMVTAP